MTQEKMTQEKILEKRGAIPPDPKIAREVNEPRAREITGVVHHLLSIGRLDKNNLFGRIVDIGTSLGAGGVALEALGAKDVVGVDQTERSYAGFRTREILGNKFIHKSAAAYLRSLPDCTVRLITAFYAEIRLSEFFTEAKRVLTPGGQILVTTDIPEFVGFLNGGTKLNVDEDWEKLPIGDVPIAQREAFQKGELSFVLSDNHPERDLARDRFFYIATRLGTK